MPIRNFKTHAISIVIISAVIVLVYVIFAPEAVKSGTQNQLRGDRYIQIDSASWGLNCNPYIDDALRKWKSSDSPVKTLRNIKPHHVNTDNVLSPISDACNGKITCNMDINPETMGDDPMQTCPKRLELRYRCSTFEPLVIKSYNTVQNITIDCQAHADKPASAVAAHP